MQITVSGINIEVYRKNIKNINLSVLPPDGRVRVSAPKHISDEQIIMFIQSKLIWIRKHQAKFQNQPKQAASKYVSGKTLFVFGQQYLLRVEHSSRRNSLVLQGNEAILNVRKESNAEQREAFINEWYRALLKEQIKLFLPKWEKITGLYCDSWQIKNMKTRWGTCNIRTRKIWLNLQLAKKPIECLEYVILHELAHLKVPNHGKDFIAIMDHYMPDWRDVRARLNGMRVTI